MGTKRGFSRAAASPARPLFGAGGTPPVMDVPLINSSSTFSLLPVMRACLGRRRSREKSLLDSMGAGRARVRRGRRAEEPLTAGWRSLQTRLGMGKCVKNKKQTQIWWVWEAEGQHPGLGYGSVPRIWGRARLPAGSYHKDQSILAE